jgi:hypothetical protein
MAEVPVSDQRQREKQLFHNFASLTALTAETRS